MSTERWYKGKKLDNTQEFNEGLKAGKNIIIIECANGKEIIYNVCIPHQTVPYESNMWKTSFFSCEGNTPPQLPPTPTPTGGSSMVVTTTSTDVGRSSDGGGGY